MAMIEGRTMEEGRVEAANAGTPALASETASRKRFMALVGGAGAAGALALLAACGSDEQTTTTVGQEGDPASGDTSVGGDIDIIQYALTLELFEEDFYDQVLKSGEVRDAEARRFVEDVYSNEKEHVDALTKTVEQLGFTPTEAPETDFDSVLNGGEQRILEAAAEIENLGAAAYLGQATEIQDPRVLDAALAIHTVEARHAARFNELAGNGFRGGGGLVGSVPDGPFAEPMDMETVLRRIQRFLAQ